MNSFPSYYTQLFNSITDALAAMDRQNYGLARELLVEAQNEAEEAYISDEEA